MRGDYQRSTRANVGRTIGKLIKNRIGERMDKIIGGAIIGLGFLALVCILSGIVAWPVQLLWNHALVPATTVLHPIGFWQAWGILILSSMLFKSSHSESSKKE